MSFSQVLGMRAHVGQRAAGAAACGVGAPGAAAVADGDLRREPALVVLDDHLVDGADGAGFHHGARFAHHRVAGVVVRHAEHRAGTRGGLQQVLRLRAGVHEGFVAHHMDARFGEGLGHRVVQVVGRDDGDEVDALLGRALQLVREQGLPAGVVACIGQAQVAPRGKRLVRLR
jgi:hypothetical protein